MHRPGAKSILANTIYLSSARAITSFARIIYAIFLAKLLGAELYGLFNYGLSWYLVFIPISVLGVDTLILRGIGKDRSQAPSMIGQTLALRVVSCLSAALLSFLIGYFIASDTTSRLLLFIFSFALIGRSLSLWSNTVFIAHESSGYVLVQEVVFRLLEVLMGVFALLSGFGVIEIAIIHAASWLLQGLAGQILIRRHLLSVNLNWEVSALFGLLRDGFPFVLSAFLIAWLMPSAPSVAA